MSVERGFLGNRFTSGLDPNDPRIKLRRVPGGWRKPNPGMMWNPLEKYPDKLHCFCGAAANFQRCHKPQLKDAVGWELGLQLEGYMHAVLVEGRRPKLVIQNPRDLLLGKKDENQAIHQVAAPKKTDE